MFSVGPHPRSNYAPVVLVTGASSGIGQETALYYAMRGARLVLASRSVSQLRRVAAACGRAGAADVLVHSTDIVEQEQVEALFEAALTQFGGVDIAVQSAAVAAFGRFVDVPSEVFDAVIRTNVCGAANVARSALAHYQGRGQGQLVLVGSVLGKVTVPYMAPYVMSKFAVNALVRLLRQENRDWPGIAVHGIYPGAVDTAIYGNSANYYGYKARVLPIVDSDPASIASAIVRATNRNRSSELSVGAENWPMLLAFRFVPAVFDAIVGPFMRASAFTEERLAATTGNIFSPRPAEPVVMQYQEEQHTDAEHSAPGAVLVDAQH